MKEKDGNNGEWWLLAVFVVLAALLIVRFFR